MQAQAIVKETDEKMKKALEVVTREFSTVRTGRASVALLDGVRVDYYGTPTPLKQLATLATPDSKLITIQPWDASIIQEIEKAILKSDLGITPNNDGKIIRIGIPSLTEERRHELIKVIKKMAEEGRVSIRTMRRDAVDHIKKLEKDKAIPEDDSFKFSDEVQKLTDKTIGKIDELVKIKEAELTEV
ncbi:MAG: ribosome recycling factor [Candidatus Omnitrophica bacterium]|nr:ribosome recycling factor [Candidatus Omnitrophota bacterium]